MKSELDDDRLGDAVSRAITARRPGPSRDFELRLRAAAARPARQAWFVPAVLAAAVAVVAIVVLVQRIDGSAQTDVAAVRSAPPPAGSGSDPGTPAADTVDLLAPYQALLDRRGDDPSLGLDARQIAQLRGVADTLARMRPTLTAQRELAMVELHRALERADIDPVVAAAHYERVTAADSALRRAELNARIAARAALTAKQRVVIGQRANPTPPVTVPRVSRLRVQTTPPGAVVYLDGLHVGTSPIDVAIASGQHQLKLARAGYQSVARSMAIGEGTETEMAIALERLASPAPTTGKLTVTAFRVATVHVDGRRIGDTPVSVELTPGRHKVTIVRNGRRESRVVVIEAGRTASVASMECDVFSHPHGCP